VSGGFLGDLLLCHAFSKKGLTFFPRLFNDRGGGARGVTQWVRGGRATSSLLEKGGMVVLSPRIPTPKEKRGRKRAAEPEGGAISTGFDHNLRFVLRQRIPIGWASGRQGKIGT